MSTNRREVLKRIAISSAAAGVVSVPLIAKSAKTIEACNCLYLNKGDNSAYFTNAIVETHDKGRRLFYNDLIAGKKVLVNFMSIESEPVYQSAQKLQEVQKLLGNRLGTEFFIYSITTDPVKDTRSELQDFALEHNAGEGWTFLTGTKEVITGIKQRFFYQDIRLPHNHGAEHDCSAGLMRYGNEQAGIWGSVPHSSPAEWIVKRLEWIKGGQSVSKVPKRRGPVAIVKDKPWLYDSGNYSI